MNRNRNHSVAKTLPRSRIHHHFAAAPALDVGDAVKRGEKVGDGVAGGEEAGEGIGEADGFDEDGGEVVGCYVDAG